MKLLLVVDDHEDDRRVFSAVLTHYRYNVLLAANGLDAVDQARRHAPDLILMDLQMPVLDGWQATRLLKADPNTARTPIIAITAEDHPLPRFKIAGFCAYVRKPILPRDLVESVRKCLEGVSGARPWIDLSSLEAVVRFVP